MKTCFTCVLLILSVIGSAGDANAQSVSPPDENARGKSNTAAASGKIWDELRAREGRASSLQSQARRLRKGGKLRAAVAAYKQAIELDKSAAGAYIGLADVYSALGDWRSSATSYRKVMYDWPGKRWGSSYSSDYEHLMKFAAVLSKAGESAEARTVYNKALTQAPDDMIVFLYKPGPLQVLDRKKLNASLHLVMADLAKDELSAGKKSDAEANRKKLLDEVKEAISIAPDYAPAHLMLGQVLLYRSQYESFHKLSDKGRSNKLKAFDAYKRAAALGSGDAKDAALKGMQSYWFHDVGEAAP